MEMYLVDTRFVAFFNYLSPMNRHRLRLCPMTNTQWQKHHCGRPYSYHSALGGGVGL